MIKKLLDLKLKFAKNQKGLTLIELLVVIVILGIIAAVAIPMLSNKSTEARNNAANQTNAVVEDAVQRYVATDPAYVEGTTDVTIGTLTAGDYIADTPDCPEGYTKAGNADDLQSKKYCTVTPE